jgi:hypothetical protein
MALLKAYGDASFTENDIRVTLGPVTAVGCYLGTEETWAKVEAEWLDRLAVWGLDEFHLTDILSGRAGVSDPELCALSFARVIYKSDLHGLSASRREVSPQVHNHDSYYAAFDSLLRLLAEHMQLEFPDDSVAIFMDSDAPEDEAQAIFDRRKQATKGQLVSLTFSSTDSFPVLQCADLLAGEQRKAWLQSTSWARPETSDLYMVAGKRKRGTFWSIDTEREIAAILERLRQEKAQGAT